MAFNRIKNYSPPPKTAKVGNQKSTDQTADFAHSKHTRFPVYGNEETHTQQPLSYLLIRRH